MKTAIAIAVAGALSIAATPSRAQTIPTPASAVPVTAAGVPMMGPLVGPPTVTWLFTQGDANGGRGDTLGPGSIIFEPIRLALLGSAVPGAAGDPECRDSGAESAGTATAGVPRFASQHAAAFQLVPKLTLLGFSRGGCQRDAAAGGALVYATPIRKDIWFVASAGILHLPHAGAGGAPVTNGQARMDLMFARPKGRSYAVGIGTRGVTFGGTL
jgi:hypothetical protein